MTARIGVLVSGSGTNLQALIDAVSADDDFGGSIVVVGSDKPDAHGLQRATDAGIATFATAISEHPDRVMWEQAIVDGLLAHDVDLVVLAGFMKLVTGKFLANWPDRVVNTHPSLLPSFRGAHAVEDALEHGVKVTGLTVHLVDEQVDHGPIIAQRAVEVLPDDTADDLHERIKVHEHRLFPACVRALARGEVEVRGRTVFLAAPLP